MIKQTLIFIIQAAIVAFFTTALTAECYLYYKQEIEKPTTIQQADCPTNESATEEKRQYKTNEALEKQLVCVVGFLHRVQPDHSFLLFDEEGEPIKCARKGEKIDIEYYQLYNPKEY